MKRESLPPNTQKAFWESASAALWPPIACVFRPIAEVEDRPGSAVRSHPELARELHFAECVAVQTLFTSSDPKPDRSLPLASGPKAHPWIPQKFPRFRYIFPSHLSKKGLGTIPFRNGLVTPFELEQIAVGRQVVSLRQPCAYVRKRTSPHSFLTAV